MFNNPYFKLILAIVAWAGVYQTANYLVRYMEPVTLAFSRYFIASVILVCMLKKYRGSYLNLPVFKPNWRLLVGIGIVGIGLYNLAFFGAEKYLSGNMVALIFSVSPCLTAFLASVILKQRVGVIGYLGMLVACLGTIGVINYANPACGRFFCIDILNHTSRGEVYAIILCILAAFFSVMNKQASMRKIDSLTITTHAAVFGTILLFFCTITLGSFTGFWHKPLLFWLALAYVSVIGSVLAYFWYSEAISQLGVSKVVVFLNGIPFVTILLGIVFLHTPVSSAVIMCGIIIISGVLLTNYAINKRS